MSDTLPFQDCFDKPLSKAEGRAKRRADKVAKQPGSKPLVAKTKNQGVYLGHLNAGRHVFAVGGAGTGKTYMAARVAARQLVEGKIEKIIVCRVAVSKPKHAMGFLPGNIDMKMKPWLTPVIDGIRAEVSGATLDAWKAAGQFEIVPFEHMRGRTFAGAFVLLDEAQNADYGDLKMFVTRAGEDSQVVITGDLDQIDIPNSGLCELVELVLDYDVPMEVVKFAAEDVVRSKLARAFVMAFERHERSKGLRKPELPSLRLVPKPVYDADHVTADEDGDAFLDMAPAFLNNGASFKRAA